MCKYTSQDFWTRSESPRPVSSSSVYVVYDPNILRRALHRLAMSPVLTTTNTGRGISIAVHFSCRSQRSFITFRVVFSSSSRLLVTAINHETQHKKHYIWQEVLGPSYKCGIPDITRDVRNSKSGQAERYCKKCTVDY
jgi:hypothetical protein